MSDIKFVGGLDIGNGYTKGIISDFASDKFTSKIDMPSGVAYVTMNNGIKTPIRNLDVTIDNLHNEADVSFDTPVIDDNNRRFLGRRGVSSGFPLEEFDVYSHVSKVNQNVSYILILGAIACSALQKYYSENKHLPADDEVIEVEMSCALALPIREFKKHREIYGHKFMDNTHFVTFHNFDKPVRVMIKFSDVQVLAEGASAQYAINSKGREFVDALLADCRTKIALDPAITADDVINASTTIGVDIGEGTINFPIFQNGQFNSDVSFTYDKGYGNILLAAMDRLKDDGFPFDSRKSLSEYLQKQPTAITRNNYNRVLSVVDEETAGFVQAVRLEFSKLLTKVGAYAEVIYVYGGGASPIKEVLYPVLCDVLKDYNLDIPILYLDSMYSRFLNREGLFVIQRAVGR